MDINAWNEKLNTDQEEIDFLKKSINEDMARLLRLTKKVAGLIRWPDTGVHYL